MNNLILTYLIFTSTKMIFHLNSLRWSALKPRAGNSLYHIRTAKGSLFSIPDRYSSHSNNMDHLKTLTENPSRQISDYWISRLKQLDRPSAIEAIQHLLPSSPLGYIANSRKVAQEMEKNKMQHKDKIILCRIGDFYEAYGVDAIMLHNYYGLNFMRADPIKHNLKAGTQWKSVQSLLNSLTNAGLSVAIYEQVEDNNADRGPSKSNAAEKGKQRFLNQIVHPGSKTYVYDSILTPEDVDYQDSVPFWGVLKTSDGYELHEVVVDEKVVRIYAQLTIEGLKTYFDQKGYTDPVYIHDTVKPSELPFLTVSTEALNCPAKEFHNQLLRRIKMTYEIPDDIFHQFDIANISSSKNRPRALYTSTAEEIGLSKNRHVDPLVPNILSSYYSAHSSRFLQDWLMHPPSYDLAENMQHLCRWFANSDISLPINSPIAFGKTNALLTAKECNVPLFKDIYKNVQAVYTILEKSSHTDYTAYDDLVKYILPIVSYKSTIPIDKDKLRRDCREIMKLIENIVDVSSMIKINSNIDKCTEDPYGHIPTDFFFRNENDLRGRMNIENPQIKKIYDNINESSKRLIDITNTQFPFPYSPRVSSTNTNVITTTNGRSFDDEKNKIVFIDDSMNNIIGLKDKPKEGTYDSQKIQFIKAMAKSVKREGKQKKLTTKEIEDACKDYIEVVEEATIVFKSLLQSLCDSLIPYTGALSQCAHWSVILEAVYSHTTKAVQEGWVLADIDHTNDRSLIFKGLSPYWIERNMAVINDIELNGMVLLTAPNMSGKSTIMRSIMVAALLANCGLWVPASQAIVPRFDNYLLRTSCNDVPGEGMSAFGHEMKDLTTIVRDCTEQSLVMIDELGKGTSTKEGTSLCGSVLEYFDKLSVKGIFATHLHELFKMELKLTQTVNKRMGYYFDSNSNTIKWKYTIEDGICTNSMALVTAAEYGIPDKILHRWNELSVKFEELFNPNTINESSKHEKTINSIRYTNSTSSHMETNISNSVIDNTTNANMNTSILITDIDTNTNTNTKLSIKKEVGEEKRKRGRPPSGNNNNNNNSNNISSSLSSSSISSLTTAVSDNDIDTITNTSDITTDISSDELVIDNTSIISNNESTSLPLDLKAITTTSLHDNVTTDSTIILQDLIPLKHDSNDIINNINEKDVNNNNIDFDSNIMIDSSLGNITTESSESLTVLGVGIKTKKSSKKQLKNSYSDISIINESSNSTSDIISSNNNISSSDVTTTTTTTTTTIDFNSNNNSRSFLFSENYKTSNQQSTLELSITPQQQGQSSLSTYDQRLFNAFKKYDLKDIYPLLIRISGVKNSSICTIEHDHNPPITLANKSCVYVLHIHKNPDVLYVGETNSISQRLGQHRITYKSHVIRAVAFPATDSNVAKFMENQIIKVLKKDGYTVHPDGDRNTKIFSINNN